MKTFYLSILILFPGLFFSQGGIVKREACYERGANKAAAMQTSRYADFDCGKIEGVLDCSEKLTMDEGTNAIMLGDKPYTGKCETCHDNGIKARSLTFVNGRENGTDTSFYPSGCKQTIRTQIMGKENGIWTYFADSTEAVLWEINYFAGSKEGKSIYYKYSKVDGILREDTSKIEYYKNGILDGVKKVYYPSGKLQRLITYRMGNYEGPFRIFNEEGKIIESLMYKNNIKDGEATYFYDDGKPLRNEIWSKGLKNGTFKTFYYNGTIQVSETYKNGIKEGEWQSFFSDQKMENRKLYKKDVLIEEEEWDKQGKKIKSFGMPETSKAIEDDEIPDPNKPKADPKKEKKKKVKKEKKKKIKQDKNAKTEVKPTLEELKKED
jgi:antitoxin component YwqK of YwqJK toxin-antitoxin module